MKKLLITLSLGLIAATSFAASNTSDISGLTISNNLDLYHGAVSGPNKGGIININCASVEQLTFNQYDFGSFSWDELKREMAPYCDISLSYPQGGYAYLGRVDIYPIPQITILESGNDPRLTLGGAPDGYNTSAVLMFLEESK